MGKRSARNYKSNFWIAKLLTVIVPIAGALAVIYFTFGLQLRNEGACVEFGALICSAFSMFLGSIIFAVVFGLLWHFRLSNRTLMIITTVVVVLLILSIVFVKSVNAHRTKEVREKYEASLKGTIGECGLTENPKQWEECISKYSADIKSSVSCKGQVFGLLFLPKPESYEICDKVFHGAIVESQIVQCNSLKEVQELKFCGYDMGYLVWPLETPEVCSKLVSSIARSACFYESLVIEEHFVEYMKDEELRRSVCSQLDEHDFESAWAKSRFDMLCKFTNSST